MKLQKNMNEEKVKEDLYNKGLAAFENHNFYDAHEYWEDLWSDFRLKDAKFVQALIQLSVGYFHITNNNRNGALGLLNKCIPKFKEYLPVHRNINVEYILRQINLSIQEINKIDELNKFNWKLVPKIKEE